MTKPTAEQINAEADLLEKMKPNVRKFTAFGDNNHLAIEAQIRVLREGLDEGDIYDLQEDGEFEERDVDVALDAQRWAAGEEDEAPSDGWKPLLVN